jgi:hypothetical protein
MVHFELFTTHSTPFFKFRTLGHNLPNDKEISKYSANKEQLTFRSHICMFVCDLVAASIPWDRFFLNIRYLRLTLKVVGEFWFTTLLKFTVLQIISGFTGCM